MDNALNYYSGDQFSSEVWKKKYAQPGESSPVDMHLRMAKEFARVRFKKDQSKTYDEWVDYFFDLFDRFQKTIPQGRVMAGVGSNGTYRSLSNCLRLPPPNDSYSSIMKVDTMLVNSAKRGCGYGVGLSKLRPKGAATKNSSRTSTGTVLFGERFSNSTKEVGQEGRRGACLLDLDIRHPDSPEFATVKMDKTKLTGANISFKVRKDFLKAVKNDEDYILRFPVDVESALISTNIIGDSLNYNELYSFPGNEYTIYLKKVRAKELWDSAIHTVWAEGCPGLQFWDEIVNFDPSSVYEKYRIDGTNACGEQPMAAFDTCRLLTLMLLACVKNPFTKNAEIDYNLLYEYSYIQMEVGDDLIDLEIEHIEKIIAKIISDPEDDTEKAIELELWTKVLDMAKSGRRVGGGITALADMLAALNIKYDSDKALYTVDQVMRTKFEAELNANMDLAEKYGTFEGWNPELEYRGNDWYKWLEYEFPNEFRRMQKVGRRFINWNTIAPVGTTSAITLAIKYPGVSSGCEPSFGCYHFRNKKVENDIDPYDFIDEVGIKWKQFPVIMGAFKDWIEINSWDILGRIDPEFDSLTPKDMEWLYEHSPWFGCLAQDIDWKKRIEMQAILQKYTTSAISSTINLPNNATEETISAIYMYAAEKGLKGITCYRDGSKGGVLVHTKKEVVVEGRPKSLQAKFYPTVIKGKKFAIIVGIHNNTPYEVFAFADPIQHEACTGEVIREKKGVYSFKSENGDIPNLELAPDHADEIIIGRFVSGLLKHGATIEFIVDQINKTPLTIPSFGKAVSRVLKTYIKDDVQTGSQCPECSSYLVYEEGCKKCKSCGYSAC